MRARTLIYLIIITIQIGGIFASESFSQEKPAEVLSALQNLEKQTASKPTIIWHENNRRIKTLSGKLSGLYSGTPEQAATQFLKENPDLFSLARDLQDIQIETVRDISHGQFKIHFQQTVGTLPVFDGGLEVYIGKDNRIEMVHNYYVPNISISLLPRITKEEVIELVKTHFRENCRFHDKRGDVKPCPDQPLVLQEAPRPQLGIFEYEGQPHLVYRLTLNAKSHPALMDYTIDANSGEVLMAINRVQSLDGGGQVFDPNPVNNFISINVQDNNDADDPSFSYAYKGVTLREITQKKIKGKNYHYLIGPYVDVTDSLKDPFYFSATSGYASSLSNGWLFTRSYEEFEHAMIYYHIDTNQRYIQSLGFTINNRPIKADPHGNYFPDQPDNSFYIPNPPGAGYLLFGDGGVDDAEDADVILHEYAHAIQDNQAPGKYSGCSTEAGAMGEGFGDYWASSNTYTTSIENLFDPACFAEWDGSPGCLRRVDKTKHYPEDKTGECHADGEIWSSALWNLFKLAGKTTADGLILKSHTNVPMQPKFKDGAQAILQTDATLYNGNNKPAICLSMMSRGIIGTVDYPECGMIFVSDSTATPKVFTKTGTAAPPFTAQPLQQFTMNGSYLYKEYFDFGVSASIDIFTKTGEYIKRFGSYGTGTGQFSMPFEIAVDVDSTIYTVESGSNGRVQVFSKDGTFLYEFPVNGNNIWVALDASNLYLLASDRVRVYSKGGAYLYEFGPCGLGELCPNGFGNFFGGNVKNIAVDATNVYIGRTSGEGSGLNIYKTRVHAKPGEYVTEIPFSVTPKGAVDGIAFDVDSSSIYVASYTCYQGGPNPRVVVYSKTGLFVSEFDLFTYPNCGHVFDIAVDQ